MDSSPVSSRSSMCRRSPASLTGSGSCSRTFWFSSQFRTALGCVQYRERLSPPSQNTFRPSSIPGCCCSSFWADMSTPLVGAWVLVSAKALGPQEGSLGSAFTPSNFYCGGGNSSHIRPHSPLTRDNETNRGT
jgi:hypothetical protein